MSDLSSLDELIASYADAAAVNAKLDELKQSGTLSSEDMLKMQLLMNQLSQLSEMSTAVIQASDSAMSALSRSIKS